MEFTHKPIEAVRAYLLGNLDDDAAAAIAERYFVDRAFFLELKAAEAAMIAEYVGGRMDPAYIEAFERRYLVEPQLKEMVDEAKKARHLEALLVGWPRMAIAASLIAASAAGVSVYWMRKPPPAPTAVTQLQRTPRARPVVGLRLKPGLIKGGPAGGDQLTVPPDGLVQLVAELPGIPSPVDCTADLFLVTADGGTTKVWTSGQPVRSTISAGGQAATLLVNSPSLRGGDYVLEVAAGSVRETYVFRMNLSR